MDTIGELNSGQDIGQAIGAVEQSPFLPSGLHELEDHRQARDPRAVAFRTTMPQPHRGKRAFDGIGRPQMNPMLRREVVKRQQLGPILE